MKKKLLKQSAAFFVALAMILTGANIPGPAAGAKAKKATIKLSKTSVALKKGKKLTLKLKTTNIKKIKSRKWTTSKKSVAAVTQKGVVTGKKAGKATIKVKVGYIAKGAKKTQTKTLKCKVTVTESTAVIPTAEPVSRDAAVPFRNLSSTELVKEMGVGWNLGNTMDAFIELGSGETLTMNPSETLWQGTKTTKEIMKKLHDKGFRTVRIPVTWGDFIQADYSVNEDRIARVQEIVDYAVEEDLYAVINIHHDGADSKYWLTLDDPTHKEAISDADFAKVLTKFKGLWKTIAVRFENYDEHLLFEGMNEVWGQKAGYGINVNDIGQDMKRINALNQGFVDVVRATGGNNDKRWLICPCRNTSIPQAIDEKYGFQVPTDAAKHVMIAVHDYNSIKLSGVLNSFNENLKDTLCYNYKKLKEIYIDKGVPVFMGEYGTLNSKMKVSTAEGFGWLFKKYGIASAVWDNNGDMAVIHRKDMTDWESDGYSVAEAIVRGYYHDTADAQIVEKPVITPLTAFETDTADIILKAGESKTLAVTNRTPADSNDVVVWGSSDSTVASVHDGTVTAKTIGTATITACSRHDGTVKKEIRVTVTKNTLSNSTTEIHAPDSIKLAIGDQGHLNAYALPVGNGASIKYESSAPEIVAVSSMGTLRAKGTGQVVITMTSSDGTQKRTTVTSGPEEGGIIPPESSLNLALHLQYDYMNAKQTMTFDGTELSQAVHVTKDGTYTLSFDCTKDLTGTASLAGIRSMEGLASLSIRDRDVTLGIYRRSPNIKGQLRCTGIKVDGKEILSAPTEYQKALQADGVFASENLLALIKSSGAEAPQKVEVTFELNGF